MSIAIGNKTVSNITIGGKNVSKIEIGGKTAYELPDYLCFTNISGVVCELTLTRINTNGTAPTVNLEYSTDKVNWTVWTETNDVRTYTIPVHGKVYLRGDNEAFGGSSSPDGHKFSSNHSVGASGDLMTLLDKTGTTRTAGVSAFRQMFLDWLNLKTAPSISATSADKFSFQSAFAHTGITESPEIFITNAAKSSMNSMFKDCPILTTAGDIHLSDVGEYSLADMFYNCTSLTTAPSVTVSSISGGNGCYSMFNRCTSLTDASNITLNATTITTSAYQNMFYGCTSLTTTPTITSSALTVGENGMNSMFYNCSNLVNAPSLTISSVNGGGACNGMFYGCSKLTGVNGLKLNATSLPNGAYKQMFRGCSELVTPPEIMATTLSDGSGNYDNGSLAYMFYNCSKLASIKVHFTNWNSGNYTKGWTYGTKSTGTFYKPSSLPSTKNTSGNTTNPNYIPYNWTVSNI